MIIVPLSNLCVAHCRMPLLAR